MDGQQRCTPPRDCEVCRDKQDTAGRARPEKSYADFGSQKKYAFDQFTVEQIGTVVRRMMNQEYQGDIVDALSAWRQELFRSIDSAIVGGAMWLHSDAGKDLLWYANVLPFHVARHVRDGYGEGVLADATADEIYVLHSIDESVDAICCAFEELMRFKETRTLLLLSYSTFTHIREELSQHIHTQTSL